MNNTSSFLTALVIGVILGAVSTFIFIKYSSGPPIRVAQLPAPAPTLTELPQFMHLVTSSVDAERRLGATMADLAVCRTSFDQERRNATLRTDVLDLLQKSQSATGQQLLAIQQRMDEIQRKAEIDQDQAKRFSQILTELQDELKKQPEGIPQTLPKAALDLEKEPESTTVPSEKSNNRSEEQSKEMQALVQAAVIGICLYQPPYCMVASLIGGMFSGGTITDDQVHAMKGLTKLAEGRELSPAECAALQEELSRVASIPGVGTTAVDNFISSKSIPPKVIEEYLRRRLPPGTLDTVTNILNGDVERMSCELLRNRLGGAGVFPDAQTKEAVRIMIVSRRSSAKENVWDKCLAQVEVAH